MKHFTHAIFILVFACSTTVYGQNTGKILLIADTDADVMVDGDKQGNTTPGNAFKIELSPGEHYIQIQATINTKLTSLGQTVNVEAGKQQIIRLYLLNPVPASDEQSKGSAPDTINIANLDFPISGSLVVALWMTDHPDESYPDPVYYYILDKDDLLLLDFRMDNKKGTNIIEVKSYPDGNALYTDNNLVSARNLTIKIPARGIYGISFATNHAFDRSCNLRVRKIPGSAESKSLSPAVTWKTISDTLFRWVTDTIVHTTFKPVTLQAPLKSWVNSGSNAFLGGRSRLTIPINLPDNTVEWYYIASAYRDEASMNKTMGTFGLLADVSRALDISGATGFAITLLTTPPGADYCDVYLLDYVNRPLFYDHEDFRYLLEGTRLNITNGLIKITDNVTGLYYLGLRNPDSYYGEFVAIEAVAVVSETTREMKRERKAIRIREKKLPVMPG